MTDGRMAVVRRYADQYRWRRWSTVYPLLGDLSNTTVLDAGCGIGDQARDLSRRGAAVVGIDANPEVIGHAAARGIPRARFLSENITSLEAAIRRRHPAPGLIFHSDRGSEYCAVALRDRLVARGYRQSAARRGPEDNAHIESFFHSLKAELIHGTHVTTPEALRRAIAQYVRYYNFQRAHSALDYRTPVDYETAVA